MHSQLTRQVIVEDSTSTINPNRASERMSLFNAAGSPVSIGGGGDRITPLFLSRYNFNPSGDPASWPLRSDQSGYGFDPANAGFIVGPDNEFWDTPNLIGLHNENLTPIYNGSGQIVVDTPGFVCLNVQVGTKTINSSDHYSHVELQLNVYSSDFEEFLELRSNVANSQSVRTHLGISLSLCGYVNQAIVDQANGEIVIDPRVYLIETGTKNRTTHPYIFTSLHAFGSYVSTPELV